MAGKNERQRRQARDKHRRLQEQRVAKQRQIRKRWLTGISAVAAAGLIAALLVVFLPGGGAKKPSASASKSPSASASGDYKFPVSSQATGRYVLIWLTSLPQLTKAPAGAPSGHTYYEGQIYNVVVSGSAVSGSS